MQCAYFGSSSSFNSLVGVLHPSLDVCTTAFISARNLFLLTEVVQPLIWMLLNPYKACHASVTGYVVYSLFGLGVPISPSVTVFPWVCCGERCTGKSCVLGHSKLSLQQALERVGKACSVVLQCTRLHSSLVANYKTGDK